MSRAGAEISHFTFNLDELSIDTEDIERLMGYSPGNLPDPFPRIIQDVYEKLTGHSEPEGGYTILGNPEFDLEANQTRVGDQTFLTDKIVTRMLRKSDQLALFICTAGEGMEKWARELNEAGDPVMAFVIDAFGSEIAEAIANKLQSIIEKEAGMTGKSITNRYSPGYCGWPVRNQQELFTFFPSGFCGIRLSESSLMRPIKSVSGIIGIGREVKNRPYTCDNCKDEHCIYRRLRKSEPS
jgi:hypothetical protein